MVFGGWPVDPQGFGRFNLRDTFQDISPSIEIEETYVDVFLQNLDLRIGKQKFAWGRLDSLQPVDVVNPRRYSDPFVLYRPDELDAKIGIPSVRASYFPPPLPAGFPTDVQVTLVWVPLPVPARFPSEDERWFPGSISVPSAVTLPPGLLGEGAPGVTIDTDFQTENRRPAWQLDEGAVALRVNGLWRGADWDLYFYDGNETRPAFTLSSTVFSPGARRALAEGRVPTIDDLTRLSADADLEPAFGRIRMVGAATALQAGNWGVRGEMAWTQNRLLPRSTQDLLSARALRGAIQPRLQSIVERLLAGQAVAVDLGDLFVARDTVDWGLGVDYPWRGWTPILQLNQTFVLDNDEALLVPNVDTRVVAALRRSLLGDRLEAEVGAVQGIGRSYTSGTVRFTYAITDDLRLRLGYLLVAGTRQSLVGQYHDNDEGFVQLRYSY
jgi:hypothetical protein